MNNVSNGLTPAQAERLAILAEECGEVIQVIGKILRHGLNSKHPDGGPMNSELLMKEFCDATVAAHLIVDAGDAKHYTDLDYSRAREKKLAYCHHQGDPQ